MKIKVQIRWSLMLVTAAVAIGIGALPSQAADLAAAHKSFQGFCAACHGAAGKGDGPTAANLAVKPTDFADCAAMTKFSDATLFKAIKSGGKALGKSAEMPAWGGAFDDSEIRNLVAYVRTFCHK